MNKSRRKFVSQTSSLLFSLQPFLKVFARPNINVLRTTQSNNKTILVIVHLAGGNDWLNTIIPYRDSNYYHSRPNLAISSETVLPISKTFAFPPSMSAIKALYDRDKVAVLLNAAEELTLSHHQALEICQSRLSALCAKLNVADHNLIFPAINIDPSLSQPLVVTNLSPNNGFLFDLDIHYRLDNLYAADYPENIFAPGFDLIADMIRKNSNARIYNISLGGFDTHSNQLSRHTNLLQMLSETIFAFQNTVDKMDANVLILVQSEIGRSIEENNGLGTDHGPTNHALLIGSQVKGGIYELFVGASLFRIGADFLA